MKWLLLLVAVAVSGCATIGRESSRPETTAWRAIPLSATWTYQPTATYAIGRDMGRRVEQKVGLANETVIAGDNLLVMQGHRDGANLMLMPQLKEFMTLVDGHLYPFTAPVEGQLVQAVDEAGVYNWAEMAGRDGETCVLAMRRLRRDQALLPADFVALDIVLRNCTPSDRADAMAPFAVNRVAAANVGGQPEASRALSHLAGPRGRLATAPNADLAGGRP